jgi:putative membrane protein (TIGR04086 family)
MSNPQKNNHKKTTVESSPFGNLMQSALFGALCGMISAILLLFAATAICYATADPCALIMPLGLAALYLSSFIAGFAALRRNGSMALACGSLSGLCLLLVFLCLSLLLRSHITDTLSPTLSLLLRAIMIPSSVIGGYLGLSRKSPKKRHAHK